MKNEYIKTIKALSESYKYHKYLLEEYNEGYRELRPDVLSDTYKIVGRMEHTVNTFEGVEHDILRNDALQGKLRVCEDEYISRSKYYFIREELYKKYIRAIV